MRSSCASHGGGGRGGEGSMLRKHTWLAYFMLATLLIYQLFIQREAQTLAGPQG